MESQPFQSIGPGSILVDYGPVHMSISAWAGDQPAPGAAEAGAKRAVGLLHELSAYLSVARQPLGALNYRRERYKIKVLKRMIAAVDQLGEKDFTPMAAVAGTFSDLVKERIVDHGADRVIVNNGGDISFCIGAANRPLKVGIVADCVDGHITHVVHVGNTAPWPGVEGIATSGFGGRSLTKGIASAVTCFAANGSLADAAATAIANATDCNHPGIERSRAETLDPLTDLKGQRVTSRVGKLSPEAISIALNQGLERAKQLYANQMIAGVIIFVQKQSKLWPEMLDRVIEEKYASDHNQ